MSDKTRIAEQILSNPHLKGLRTHLQPDEIPLATVPAIWEGGQGQRSMPCDIVLTNQRLIGYVYVTFPRERLFLDALALVDITAVSIRHKSFEPIFRELMVSTAQRTVYIRAPRQKIETLYEALRSAIEEYAPKAETAFDTEPAAETEERPNRPAPVYERQEIRTPFERSSLAIILLFVGGIILEIFGVIVWAGTHSASTGLPLCVAGFAAVLTAILTRRRR